MADVALPRTNIWQGETLQIRRGYARNGGDYGGHDSTGDIDGIETGWQCWYPADAASHDIVEPGAATADTVHAFAGVARHFIADGDAGQIACGGDTYLRVGASVTAGAMLYPNQDDPFFQTSDAGAVTPFGMASPVPFAVALESLTYASGTAELVLARLFPHVMGIARVTEGGG